MNLETIFEIGDRVKTVDSDTVMTVTGFVVDKNGHVSCTLVRRETKETRVVDELETILVEMAKPVCGGIYHNGSDLDQLQPFKWCPHCGDRIR